MKELIVAAWWRESIDCNGGVEGSKSFNCNGVVEVGKKRF